MIRIDRTRFLDGGDLVVDTSDHSFRSLFVQLGLNSSNEAIAEFISSHKLKGSERIDQADFWTPAQAEFFRESWLDDSDWVGVIEQLNTVLHN